jgi:hypothetical protein
MRRLGPRRGRRWTLVLLLGLLAGSAQAQCLDTNTLLDSVRAVSRHSLNALRHRANDTISGDLPDGWRNGQQYMPLLLHKIFQRHLAAYYVSGPDLSVLNFGASFRGWTVTRLTYQPGPHVRVAVLHWALDQYLLTLRDDLSLIDLVAIGHFEPPVFNPGKTKADCVAFTSGLYAELTSTGLLTQTDWSRREVCNTGRTKSYEAKKKQFQLSPDGRFVAQ